MQNESRCKENSKCHLLRSFVVKEMTNGCRQLLGFSVLMTGEVRAYLYGMGCSPGRGTIRGGRERRGLLE